MATFVSCAFTDTDATNLESHTPEGTGDTWTEHGSYTAGNTKIYGNRASVGVQPSVYYASGTPATAEYDVTGVIRCMSASGANLGVCGRIATGANTMYWVRYDGTVGGWQLFKFVAGTATQLESTVTQTLTNGVDYTVKLEIRDATKKVYVDGVEIISSTDNAITAAGRAGFRASVASGTTTGLHLDSLIAEDPAGGGAAEDAAGVVAGVSTVSGTLTATVPVAGASAGVSTASGTVRATVPVAGLTAGTSTAVGAIKVAAGIAGAAAGTSTVSGTLSSTVPISASTAGASTVSGTVRATTPISGATAGTSTVGGSASATVPISGASAGASTLSGTLAGQGQELAAGTVVGQSTVSGTLTSTVPVQAVSAGVSTVSANLTVESEEGADEAVAGVIAATSTLSGTLSVQIQVAASAASTSSLAAALSSFVVVAGSSAGVSTVSANLSGGEELLPAIRTASSDSAYGTVVSSDVALTGVTADRVLVGATASDSEG